MDVCKQELLLYFCEEEALDLNLVLVPVLVQTLLRALHGAGFVDPAYE